MIGGSIGFIEVVAGGLGMAWALSGFARLQRHPPRFASERFTCWGLLLTGMGLVAVGLIQWITGEAIA